MAGRLKRFVGHFRRLGARFWITFIAACVIVEGGEFAFDRILESEHGGVSNTLFGFAGLYQKIVNAPRTPTVRFTTIVEIDPEKDAGDVSLNNVCSEREFLAHLLRRIALASPDLIVIDKYFGRNSCREDDVGTGDLIKTVQTIRLTLPLLVGVRAKEIDAEQPGHGARSFLEQSLDFGRPLDGSPGVGVLNVAQDNRRLPLEWLVYSGQNDVKGGNPPIIVDTLALAVAKAHDSQFFEKAPQLKSILEHGEQPYLGFIDRDGFKRDHLTAGEALCGHFLREGEDWEHCEENSAAGGLRTLRSKIVLIGERNDADEHQSVVGAIPGFYLQANYIEALLDARYYRSAGFFLDYGFGFVFLVALELILLVYHREPISAVLLILALVIVSFAIDFAATVNLKIYLDPVPVTFVAVLIKCGHMVFNYVPPQGVRKRKKEVAHA